MSSAVSLQSGDIFDAAGCCLHALLSAAIERAVLNDGRPTCCTFRSDEKADVPLARPAKRDVKPMVGRMVICS